MGNVVRFGLICLILSVLAAPAMAQAPAAGAPAAPAIKVGPMNLGAAIGAMSRQPEAAGNIQTAMIISAALIEGATFFALIVCMLFNS